MATGETLDEGVFAAPLDPAVLRPRRLRRPRDLPAGRRRPRGRDNRLLPRDPAVAVRRRWSRAWPGPASRRRPRRRREAVRPRPRVGAGAGRRASPVHRRVPALPIDHFLGKMGRRDPHLRFANAMLEPIWNRNYWRASRSPWPRPFGGEDRGSFYDPVGALRDVVHNHLLQMLAPPPWSLRRAATRRRSRTPWSGVPRRWRRPTRRLRPRAVRRLPRDPRGLPRLDDRDLRRAAAVDRQLALVRACRSSSARASGCRCGRPSCDSCSSSRPGSVSARRHHRPEPNQLVVRVDPVTGVRIRLDASVPTRWRSRRSCST